MPRPWSAPMLHSAHSNRFVYCPLLQRTQINTNSSRYAADRRNQAPSCTVAEAAWSHDLGPADPCNLVPDGTGPALPSNLLAQAQSVPQTTAGGCSAPDPPTSCEGAPQVCGGGS